MNKDINRLKIILVEKKKTNRWLASQLGKDESTVSKWCTNTSQPSLEQLREIANEYFQGIIYDWNNMTHQAV